MNRVKKGLDNQAIGLLPLLLFMFLDNYFSYLLSFIIAIIPTVPGRKLPKYE